MSTKKNTPRPNRQSSNQTIISKLRQELEFSESAALDLRRDKVSLQQQLESLAKSLGQERLFWYYMAYNFRFHHAMAAVAVTSEEKANAADNLQTATLDLLMSPSEPSSSFTRSFHQDYRLHRILAGQPNDIGSDQNLKTGRLVNASTIA